MKQLKVDHALKPGTQIGPVVDQKQLEQDLRYLEIGQKEGGKLAFGGERLNRETEGYYLAPALITETSNQMRINREEIFGPVAAVIRVKDYDEALAGRQRQRRSACPGGICTTSLKHASHFKRNAEAGLVMVNLPTAGSTTTCRSAAAKARATARASRAATRSSSTPQVKTAYTAP